MILSRFELMSREHDSTKYLEKKLFQVESCERIIRGNAWAMYKDNDKRQTSIENSSPLCQTYTPNFRLET